MAGWLTCPADYLWIRSVRELIAIICLMRQRRQTKTLGDRVIGHHDDPLGDMIRRDVEHKSPCSSRVHVPWGYLSGMDGGDKKKLRRLISLYEEVEDCHRRNGDALEPHWMVAGVW